MTEDVSEYDSSDFCSEDEREDGRANNQSQQQANEETEEDIARERAKKIEKKRDERNSKLTQQGGLAQGHEIWERRNKIWRSEKVSVLIIHDGTKTHNCQCLAINKALAKFALEAREEKSRGRRASACREGKSGKKRGGDETVRKRKTPGIDLKRNIVTAPRSKVYPSMVSNAWRDKYQREAEGLDLHDEDPVGFFDVNLDEDENVDENVDENGDGDVDEDVDADLNL